MPGPPGLHYGGATGLLSINGLPMQNPAWCVLNCLPMVAKTTVRGGDVVIPGTAGRLPVEREVDAASHSLPMAISGWRNYVNGVYANPWNGLQQNIATLNTLVGHNYFCPMIIGGMTLYANLIVEGIIIGSNVGPVARAVLNVTLPDGAFG